MTRKQVIEKTQEKEQWAVNIYNMENCDYIGKVYFPECNSVSDLINVGKDNIISIVDKILMQEHQSLYSKRNETGLRVILVDKYLNPQIKIEYFIINDESDEDNGKEWANVSYVNHGDKGTFFSTLIRKYCK